MRTKRTILTSIFLFIFVVLIAVPGVGKTAVTSGDAAYPQWRASQAADDCTGPTDGDGDWWYEADFDASSLAACNPADDR